MIGRRIGAVVVAVALAGACSGGGKNDTSSDRSTTTSKGGVPDLSKLVLQQSESLPGSKPLSSVTGPRTADQLAKDDNNPKEADTLTGAGFRGAYSVGFVSPALGPATGIRARFAGSYIALFKDAPGATKGIGVLSKYARKDATAVTDVNSRGLGEDAFGIRSKAEQITGTNYAFAWRVDNAAIVVVLGTTADTDAAAREFATKLADRSRNRHEVSEADLPDMSLRADEPPPGTQLDKEHSGTRTVDTFAGAADEAGELRAAGFTAGYVTQFVPQQTGGEGGRAANFVYSAVQLYRETSGAKVAFKMLTAGRIKRVGEGLKRIDAKGLGDESIGLSFTTKVAKDNYPGFLFAFRDKAYVYAVYAYGPPDAFTLADIRAMADLLADRKAA